MKKIFILLGILAMIASPTSALEPVAEGETYHELGAYLIEKSNAPIIIDARILTTYEVKYENSEMTVRIAVDNNNSDKILTYITDISPSSDHRTPYNDNHYTTVASNVLYNIQ